MASNYHNQPAQYTHHEAHQERPISQLPPYSTTPEYHAPAQQHSAGTTIRFPTKLVYDVAWVSTTSYLGLSKHEHRYAVETPSRMLNCFGLGTIVLRDGTDKSSCSSPVLATVQTEPGSKFRRSLIKVSPRPGTHYQKRHLEISMAGDWSRTHPFELPLDNGTVESFEWRNTRGQEVREVSGGFTSGWKLVRLRSATSSSSGHHHGDGSGSGSGAGYTSDGQEVVAVGAHARLLHKNPEFAFVGAGARGELGETFEIVAVMGFLRLYELSTQQSTVNANAAAASGASVAAA